MGTDPLNPLDPTPVPVPEPAASIVIPVGVVLLALLACKRGRRRAR